MLLSKQQLFGLADDHIQYADDRPALGLQADVWAAFETLCLAARAAGFAPAIASGFRHFDRQRVIWNGKANGERAIMDDDCRQLDVSGLTAQALLHKILRFSAIPGTSRHHWGTDFDIYDLGAVPAGYELQLSNEECCEGGIFAPFHAWLSEYLAADNRVFFRPYANDHGGIAPEPWHLSYAPLARHIQIQAQADSLRTMLAEQDIALKELILDDFAVLYQRYIDVPAQRYPQAWQPGPQ